MEVAHTRRVVNYRIFLSAHILVSVAMGLFGILFIREFGGSLYSFGYSVAVMMGAGALASLFAGRLSDRFGRKRLLVASAVAFALLVILYTLINSLVELFVLQSMYGIIGSIEATAGSAFLGDATEKASRGKDIGKLYATTGIASACALAAGGHIFSWFGFEMSFYGVAAFFALSATLLLFIKE